MFGILFDACIFVPPDGNGNSAGKLKMGNIHIMTEKITIAEVAETYGRKADTLWRKAKRTWPERTWSVHSVVTEEEGRILLGDWPAPKSVKRKKHLVPNEPNGAKFAAGLKAFHAAYPPEENDLTETIIRTTETISVNQPAPDVEALSPAPGRAKFNWPSIKLPTFHHVRRFLISALLFAVVVMHGLLIWYDCSVLWDVPGQIGGGTVFIVVLAALLLASDATLPRTSGNALAFIFFVDCAAWKVHYEVFKTPVVDNIVTGSLCAFICAASFIALYLFRDSKLD